MTGHAYTTNGIDKTMNYILNKDKNPLIISANGLDVESKVSDMISDMGFVQKLNPGVSYGQIHYIITYHPNDHVNYNMMAEHARKLISDQGLGDTQWLGVAHRDREHLHFHLCLNRSKPLNGELVNDSYVSYKTKAFTWRMEDEYGLIRARDLKSDKKQYLESTLDEQLLTGRTMQEIQEFFLHELGYRTYLKKERDKLKAKFFSNNSSFKCEVEKSLTTDLSHSQSLNKSNNIFNTKSKGYGI